MYVIRARNAQQMLPELMYQLRANGVRRESRNGPVIRFPEPCTLVYEQPLERVVFWKNRDANPFFHLLEAMWMLAGRDDVAFPASIVSTMRQFSDDGKIFHGAYGYRWRNFFGFDQLAKIAKALKENPDDRRQVLAMWDAESDLGTASKDIPCNTHAYFARNATGALEMTVCNRSNDSVWGAVGANCVHFTILQEFLASIIGCPVGRYWQVSNNMHLYLTTHEELMNELAQEAQHAEGPALSDPYSRRIVQVTPICPTAANAPGFLSELAVFLEDGKLLGMQQPFIRRVLNPVVRALEIMKTMPSPQRFEEAKWQLDMMPEKNDWKLACVEWIDRRRANWEAKQSG